MRLPRWTHVGVFVLVLDACGWLNPASAVEDPPVYFAQAIGRVAETARTATNLTNFGYNEGLSLYGASLRTGASTSLSVELSPGVTYLFLGGGDDDATDVDLEIFDPSGRLVAHDTDDDATPVVRFTPSQCEFFLIRVSLERSRDQTSYCAMAILRDGGWNVPIQNMTTAAMKALRVRGELGQRGVGLKFHDEPNQWSFFGGVVAGGQNLQLNRMSLGTGYRFCMAAGDDHAQDLDLYLLDDAGVVAKDEDPDATPMVEHLATEGRSYSLRVVNARSTGPALVVAIILSK